MTAETDAMRLVPVSARDLDALRYVLNRADEASRIRTVMSTFTLPERETTAERLERLYAALKAAAPAVQPAAGREADRKALLSALPAIIRHYTASPSQQTLEEALGRILAALAHPPAQQEPTPFMFAYEDVDKPGEWQAFRRQLNRADGSICPGKPLYAHPPAQGSESGPTCQKCGGEIHGWCCQSCDAEFRENDAGNLVFDEDAGDAQPGSEGGGERVRHKARGTEYTIIGVGRAQGELTDEDPVVLYRGDDGGLWVRHQAEFSDGRFERVEATLSQPGPASEGEAR